VNFGNIIFNDKFDIFININNNMIYNQPINSKDINIKKFLKYSDNYTLIPIKYNNNDLLIQTPKMYIPFGEKKHNDKKYIDL